MAFTDNIKEITPAIADIKNNTPAIMVAGKVLVNGIGGNFIPAGQGGSATSMDFYKCAAINSDSTWSGYKAVLNQLGYYLFLSESTTGLHYSAVTPTLDEVYSANSFIKALLYNGIPTNGLVFYASLDGKTPVYAETGQYMSATGSISYQREQGIKCAKFQNSYITIEDINTPAGDADRSICWWYKKSNTGSSELIFWGYGAPSIGLACASGIISSSFYRFNAWGGDSYDLDTNSNTVDFGDWTFMCCIYLNGVSKLFKNGALLASGTKIRNTPSYTTLYIGQFNNNYLNSYMCKLRIYNRALSSALIKALANEFAPIH